MRKIALALAILGTTLVSALYTAPAHAQATRTWVSGVGDDANPCSRTAPCKTWAGAISKTSAGGEIDALDPGGFGAVTITKSITLDGGGGQVASVLVSATNGINVAAGSNDVIILKNLRFQGLLGNGTGSSGTPGVNGISVSSAAQVVIENCEIYGFSSNGINVSMGTNTGLVQVLRSQLINNAVGLSATASSGGLALVEVYNSTFVGTNTGGSSTQGGALAGANSNVTIGYSNFQDLTYGAQIQSGALLEVDNSLLFTSVGVVTNASTTAYANNNSYYGSGPLCNGGGTLKTAANNKLGGNATTGTCSVSATMTQQ
jgi:hypothetical protein